MNLIKFVCNCVNFPLMINQWVLSIPHFETEIWIETGLPQSKKMRKKDGSFNPSNSKNRGHEVNPDCWGTNHSVNLKRIIKYPLVIKHR